MSEVHWLHPQHPPGPVPAGLVRREATRQNTLVMANGEHVLLLAPDTHGGPDVWTWHVHNAGPGSLWMRWDGLGYAGIGDEHSIQLPPQSGFQFIHASALTLACQGGTTASMTADNLP